MCARPVTTRRDLLTITRAAGASERSEQVHIASLLVHALPDHIEAVRSSLGSLAGAELHATPHPAKFVVVLECADERLIAECINQLHATPGVLTVAVVSHLIEDAGALDEEMNDGREPPRISQV